MKRADRSRRWWPALLGGWLAGAAMVPAVEDEPPLLRPEDRVELLRQSEELADASSEVTRGIGRSVVWVYRDRRQVALGTVVSDGSQVLTKWSEVGGIPGAVQCVTGAGRTVDATISGVYEDDDVAVLDLGGERLEPVAWSAAGAPRPGRFLVAGLPDGRAAAFGVVGVEERSLREADQAFLGVQGDSEYQGPGVRVEMVIEGSGAEAAGIRAGDVILRVGDQRIDGTYALRAALLELEPGVRARLWISRAGEEAEYEVELGRRGPEFAQVPALRLETMKRMAGPNGVSRVGDGFPDVIQSDMKIAPKLCGSPALDLDGRVVGLVIARGTRTRSFVIPSERIVTILKQQPADPALARIGPEAPALPAGAVRRGPPLGGPELERRRERVGEMRLLLERFFRELEALEEDR